MIEQRANQTQQAFPFYIMLSGTAASHRLSSKPAGAFITPASRVYPAAAGQILFAGKSSRQVGIRPATGCRTILFFGLGLSWLLPNTELQDA